MTDLYAVIGNPIAHSKSPRIHAAFARQTGQDLVYEAILAPRDGFSAAVDAFRARGGKGMNVTVPFKMDAYHHCVSRTARAARAGAVNTLRFDDAAVLGDNTDGVGLVTDIEQTLNRPLAGSRVLLMGAGGAARGVLLPILERAPAALVIVNRTAARAVELAQMFPEFSALHGCGYDALGQRSFDVIINATSASLRGELPRLPEGAFAPGALAYDMMYGRGLTPFLRLAQAQGAGQLADGLGMLVEQAAESFYLWRGVRPDTRPVLEALRREA